MDAYTDSEIRRLLAEDPRTAEQGVRVVCGEQRIQLCGEVESAERRELIERVIQDRYGPVTIDNDLGVTRVHAPVDVEELS